MRYRHYAAAAIRYWRAGARARDTACRHEDTIDDARCAAREFMPAAA